MSFIKHIPNCITTLNLACGIVGVVFAFQGHPDLAFCMMLAAAVFDFCDGLAARALGAYSPKGKELDSLCDMVSFGVLPSVMMYDNMRAYVWTSADALAFLPLIFCLGAAHRLARFNVDDRQKESFLGLAVPVAAMIAASLCCFADAVPNSIVGGLCDWWWFLPAVSLVLVALMVCEVPMFSMKFSKGQPRDLKIKRIAYLVDCAVILAGVLFVGTSWTLAVLLAGILYVVKNFIFLLPLLRK